MNTRTSIRFTFSLLLAGMVFLSGCSKLETTSSEPTKTADCNYNNFKTPGDFQSGGVQMIDLKEGYKVWTKRFGNSPMKVLILHGGPAGTHEYLESFQSFFPQANIEFYEYDQLGSYYSDQPTDLSLYTIERFVEEVEQVRVALGLDSSNFVLLGQSWGGILALEYALKYQQNLKGMVVCNMTADFHKYAAYNNKLRNELRPSLVDTFKMFEDKEDYGTRFIWNWWRRNSTPSTSAASILSQNLFHGASVTLMARFTVTCKAQANLFRAAFSKIGVCGTDLVKLLFQP